MFKDYYKILGVSQLASDYDIKVAYRSMSIKWHPDKNQGADAISMMQDINEAYAILKDKIKRERYDREYNKFSETQKYNKPTQYANTTNKKSWEYDYEVQDESLKEDIRSARKFAEELVREFLSSLKDVSKKAATGAWDSAKNYVYGGLILLVIGIFINACPKSTIDDYEIQSIDETKINTSYIVKSSQAVVSIPKFQVPESWTKYIIDNGAFSISVPSSVELRNDYDEYTKLLKGIGIAYNSDAVVFQQKGLSAKSPSAYKQYCRIMIQHIVGNKGDFLPYNKTERIDNETKEFFRGIVDAELGGFKTLEEPTYKWIDINGTKAVEIKYRRSGTDNNTTACTLYLLFNDDEAVKMIVSYREKDKALWLPDFDNIVKTFKWK